ncbi:hypothetical protein ACFVXH_39835 [Kitasatospora sp. NPDC058184]|uniref:hypothetical protein n=1 Tax=Kitasatospora sp. NPDC058184 TaxID=3346370 RepID=UPI0036D75EB1
MTSMLLASTDLGETEKRQWAVGLTERLPNREVARAGRRGDTEAADGTIWELETPPLLQDPIVGKQRAHPRIRWLLCGVAEHGAQKLRIFDNGGGLVAVEWNRPWSNYPLLTEPLIDLGLSSTVGRHVLLNVGAFSSFSRTRAEGRGVLYSMHNWLHHVRTGIPLAPVREPWSQQDPGGGRSDPTT